MKKFGFMVLVVFWILDPQLGLAENETEDAPTMDEVVVTATRTEMPSEKAGGSSVTVVTAEDIEAKKQATIEEVIRGVPGLDINSNGGPGTQTTIFIRGADPKNTLVLVDGVMFNNPSTTSRQANIADLTVDNIERVEVVRGPQSVLYGTNATAGVVNIITKKGQGKPTVYAGLEGGSFNTWRGYAGTSGALKDFNFAFSASGIQTEGFSTANAGNDRIPHEGNTSENDGWKNASLSGNFGYDITPNFDLTAVFRYMNAEVELDDFNFVDGYGGDRFLLGFMPPAEPNGLKEARDDTGQFTGKFNVHNVFLNDLLDSNLYYEQSNHKREVFDNDGNESYDYEGRIMDVGWQGDFSFGDIHVLSLGAGYWKEDMESRSDGIQDVNATIGSLWAQEQAFLLDDDLVLVGGVRLDHHDRYGNEPTFRFAPAYTISKTQTIFKGSIGTGFRAPSLFELYSAFGNPNLDPERSRAWDLGFEQRVFERKVHFGATYYDSIYENRIDWDPGILIPGAPFPGGYNQVPGDTTINGVEAFLGWSPLTELHMMLNYTYTHTEDPNGEQLIRRPRNKVYFNIRYRPTGKWALNLDYFWVDERRTFETAGDKDGNPVEMLDPYHLVNLSASYDINRYFQIYGRVDNVFDEFYEEAWSNATPGLSAYLGLKFNY